VLIVAINSDASVKRLKGSDRPIMDQDSRAAVVASLACVSHVVVFNDSTPEALLRQVRPDVLVKGGDYAIDDVLGSEFVRGYGGQVCVTSKINGLSTTSIVERLTRAAHTQD
jgi:D-beta-D-heptose 7-phosphate kinase/D-beta-D-heptose 1-phosphate adenosyltransferase